ncbi:MAG: hypothetical protein H8E14_15745 [Candidatus Marinimicrobia bacterium]|nr:hypothetical protein [Candidatus Neomarinimicrobiota bacterium]
MIKIAVGGILELRGLTMIEVLGFPNQPGHAGKILTLLGYADVNLHFIAEGADSQGLANITICVNPEHAKDALDIIHEYLHEQESVIVKSRKNISILTVYGPHFREKPAICGNMCYILGKANVNILGISTSISSVCSIIADEDFDKAYQNLLSVFTLP